MPLTIPVNTHIKPSLRTICYIVSSDYLPHKLTFFILIGKDSFVKHYKNSSHLWKIYMCIHIDIYTCMHMFIHVHAGGVTVLRQVTGLVLH